MADEELPPVAEDGEAAPAPEPQKEPDQPDPIEALAAEIGWTPKDQFKGDPEKWKPADQFIRDGREITRSMKQKLERVEDTVSRMASTHSRLMEQQLSERDAYWQARQDEAFEAGDKDGFTTAQKERERLRQVASTEAPPPEVEDFARRHTWFKQNRLATQVAVAAAEEAQAAGKSLPEQLKAAEDEVQRRFPELFPAPVKAPPVVTATTTRATARRPSGKSFNDMPKEAQDAALKFESERGIPKEKYTELYFKRQEQPA